jgi:cytochrome c oxidase subunit IV
MTDLSLVSGQKMAHQAHRAHQEGQQHPIKLYLVIWGWLFVLSTCSYLVDYFGIEGFLRWFLILLFMIGEGRDDCRCLHAHALGTAGPDVCNSGPPGAVLLFVAIMAFESNYTNFTRLAFFATGEPSTQTANLEPQKSGSGAGTVTAPPDQLKKEAKKDGLDGSKPAVASEGHNAALSGSASAPKEARKTAPASGYPAGVAAIQNDVAATANAVGAKFYTLKPGDTLWKIAKTE